MRRSALLLSAIALTLLLAGAVALAVELNPVSCQKGVVCNGSGGGDNITGTKTADTINGRGGNDTISALGANDKIDGGPNNDTMSGGAGNDAYGFTNKAAPFGADRISADASGVDTIDFSRLVGDTAGVGFSIAGSKSVCDPTSPHCIAISGTFIENLIGTDRGDGLVGNSLNNKINGGPGDDRMNGADGNDSVLGDAGGDDLRGDGGDDRMLGGDGPDLIRAYDPGTDTVRTGTGNDKVRAQGDPGVDTIDCGDGTDTVNFDAGVDVVADNCENQHPL